MTSSKTMKDAGQYFTESGESGSQMAAARFLDTISKLPGMCGEISDAFSTYTQVKITEASRLCRLPQAECPEIWIRTPPRHRPESWNNLDDPVVPLEGHFSLVTH